MDMDRSELLKGMYDAHVKLCEHYSSLVFQGRLATVTLTVAAVAIALGLVPSGGVAPKGTAGGLLAYAAACLVALLHGVEASYVKRFFQVVASGRTIEQEIGVEYFFTKYDRPNGLPLRMIYLFAVLALLTISATGLWDWLQPEHRYFKIFLGGVFPLLLLAESGLRSGQSFTRYVSSKEPAAPPAR